MGIFYRQPGLRSRVDGTCAHDLARDRSGGALRSLYNRSFRDIAGIALRGTYSVLAATYEAETDCSVTGTRNLDLVLAAPVKFPEQSDNPILGGLSDIV